MDKAMDNRASGWVIENHCMSPMTYYCGGEGGKSFSPDHMDAVRFCRRVDAERCLAFFVSGPVQGCCSVTEHIWMGLTPEPVAPTPVIETRNETAGFIEFLNSDRPTIVRDLDGPAAILIDVDTRQVIGYRVYDPDSAYAPTPSPAPDIAGLVERCTQVLARAREVHTNATQIGLVLRLSEALDALQRVAQERDAAMADRDSHQREAILLMGEIDDAWAEFGAPKRHPTLAAHIKAALDELAGMADEERTRAEAAEARLSSARDEGLEMAAKVADAEHGNKPRTSFDPNYMWDGASDRIAAAIRALKGTKP